MPSIPDTLRTTAARCPDREALVFGGRRRTYRELYQEVERTAAALAAREIAAGGGRPALRARAGRRRHRGGGAERGLAAESLREWSRDRIADYKAPPAVVAHPIPRNPSGKIQKHLLRAELIPR
ncbi:MAG TPA: AMP-binding protein [Streptosporangiaceae bacterium]|nr:AMP-binding protein [Streptosporangiaceae bacterium]